MSLGIFLRENRLLRRHTLPATRGGDYGAKRARPFRLPFAFRKGEHGIEPKVISLDLATAETAREIEFNGNIVFFAKSTNSTDAIYVRYNDKSADAVPFLPGQAIDGVPYGKIYLSWDAISGASGTLVLMRDFPRQDVTLT